MRGNVRSNVQGTCMCAVNVRVNARKSMCQCVSNCPWVNVSNVRCERCEIVRVIMGVIKRECAIGIDV